MIDHRHGRVEVHHGMRLRQLHSDDAVRLAGGEQSLCEDLGPIGVVRSPIPIITVPFPTTCTSPPSTDAGRWFRSSSP